MKRGRVFSSLVCLVVCFISVNPANADPSLDLWMEFNIGTSTVEVHRTNTDFGLGALTYNLQFSESLNLTREYSNYGWLANDGTGIDGSTPGDGSVGSYTSILFDTARNPANSEFSPGTGIVEGLTILDLTPRWIYFDISSPVATDGSGVNLVQLPGGSLPNVISDPDAQGHTLAVQIIPEPTTMLLLSLGGIFVLRKRKK